MNNFFRKLKNAFLRVPLSEKILFAKHLAIMTKSAMSTVESLKLIRKQIKSKGFCVILDRVAADIENGQSLSTAFSQFRHIFGELFVSIIALGEASGTLSENLEYLSNEFKKSRQLRSKIRAAFIYPIIVMIFTVGVVVALVFFVLPRLTSIFAGLGVRLPITTRILIASANFIQNYIIKLIENFSVT